MAEQINTSAGANGQPVVAASDNGERPPAEMTQEEVAAREMARRYRLRYIDLKAEEPASHLIHELPVELMVRHSFVPMQRDGDVLYVAMADPTHRVGMDELEAQPHCPCEAGVETAE